MLRQIEQTFSYVEEIYTGTKEFSAKNICEVFPINKTVNFSKVIEGGIGSEQKDLKLIDEDWFAYNENFGTSEEKEFVAYFKNLVDDLRKTYSKVYLVRNERAFKIYNFEDGAAFEPDFVLFLQKKNTTDFEQLQIFIEPKGSHLLEHDAWKEKFLLQLADESVPVKKLTDDGKYKIFGLHFFNAENKNNFDDELKNII